MDRDIPPLSRISVGYSDDYCCSLTTPVPFLCPSLASLFLFLIYLLLTFCSSLLPPLPSLLPLPPPLLPRLTAALQSVFPQTELGTFMALSKLDKEKQLIELASIVTGIRLFNRDCGKGGEGIDDCELF